MSAQCTWMHMRPTENWNDRVLIVQHPYWFGTNSPGRGRADKLSKDIQIIAPQMLRSYSSFLIPNCSIICQSRENVLRIRPSLSPRCPDLVKNRLGRKLSVQCSEKQTQTLRTCKNCKTQFDPLLNHPRACCYHTAHFGGTRFLSLIFAFLLSTLKCSTQKLHLYLHSSLVLWWVPL